MQNHFARWTCLTSTACLVAACSGTTPSAETPNVRPPELAQGQAPVVATDSGLVPSPIVTSGCLTDRPRTSFVEIRWPSAPGVAPDSALLDVTVFKDGFQSGRFAVLSAAPQPRVQAYFAPGTALRALSLGNVTRRRADDTTVVRAEGLEPGINYIWRVRASVRGRQVAGAPLRVQAPTCIADEPQQPAR